MRGGSIFARRGKTTEIPDSSRTIYTTCIPRYGNQDCGARHVETLQEWKKISIIPGKTFNVISL